jgi:hypothetical protein
MHEREQSDPAIGAGKPTNKAEATPVVDAAEPVEQRVGAKGNASGQSTPRTQSRERVSQALDRVRKVARLRRHHPRREPYALIGPVRICAGGAGQPASLPRSRRKRCSAGNEQSVPLPVFHAGLRV